MSSNIPQKIPHPTIWRISVTLNSVTPAVLMNGVSVFFAEAYSSQSPISTRIF
jgi:hypothetical protein